MKNFSNKLKQEYENQQEIPSRDLWERIENKLDNTPQKTEVKYPIWIWKVASVVILIGLLGSIVLMNKEEKKVKITQSINNQERVILEKNQNFVKINTKKIISEKNHLLNKEEKQTLKQKGIETKIVTKIENPIISTDTPQIVMEKTIDLPKKISEPVEKMEYIKANDLLFSRELNKTKQEENEVKRIGINLPKPKKIEILGIDIELDKEN